MVLYDAFVSYSHAKDKPIAAALQSVIQRLGKPWYRRRALRVFRDDSSLSATPGLWPSIEQALSQSRFLILLASPEAAGSPWVNREISWWLDHKTADTLLVALTYGELSWDNTLGDFISRERIPLPPALTGRFPSEPRWVDLRSYREGANPRDARFIEAGADFAAAIGGMPKEDLLSQEVRQQRRALILAWSAAGSLMILAVLAGWQWKVATDNERAAIEQRNVAERQQALAQEQRSRAERTLEAATKTTNSLVTGLAREFRNRAGMPLDLVRTILDRAQELQRQLAEAGETSPALRSSEAIALFDVTDTLWSLGDVKAAVVAAERGCAVMEGLVSAEPAELRWQTSLSASYVKLGDVLIAAGRRDESLEQYRKALAITEKLFAGDPKNPSRRRGLANIYLRLGNSLMNSGKPEAALTEFQRSREIFAEQAEADPGNAELQRGHSLLIFRVGDAQGMLGRWHDAEKQYRSSVAIRDKLTRDDPGNTQWQDDLALSHQRLAGALGAVGRLDEALAEHRSTLAIRERQSATDPGNMAWQLSLAIDHRSVGEALFALGRREEALTEYNKSLAICERFAASDPGNAHWQQYMALTLQRVGNLLAMFGRQEEALTQLRKSIAMGEKLVALDPGSTDWQRDLIGAYAGTGDLLRSTGRQREALAEYRRSFDIAERLSLADSANMNWQFELAAAYYRLSIVAEPAERRKALLRALAFAETLLRSDSLDGSQRNWLQSIRDEAAKPPERARAK
jgi:tetratricopeptide (TPR) repeat protein